MRALIDRRVPLFEFAIRSVLAEYDLNQPTGRVAALRAAAPVVAKIRDRSLRPEYARTLAGWLGMEVSAVQQAVTEASRGQRRTAPVAATEVTPESAPVVDRPDPRDRSLATERELLKLALQQPEVCGTDFDEIPPEFYTHPAYRAVRLAIATTGPLQGRCRHLDRRCVGTCCQRCGAFGDQRAVG